jgi:hypothetical protein
MAAKGSMASKMFVASTTPLRTDALQKCDKASQTSKITTSKKLKRIHGAQVAKESMAFKRFPHPGSPARPSSPLKQIHCSHGNQVFGPENSTILATKTRMIRTCKRERVSLARSHLH